MSSRKDVLKPFIQDKALMEDRISQGIEANRKGYATLKFVDADGKPLEGASVQIHQKSHEFKYGANLFMLDEFNAAEQNQAYRQQFAQAFNIATLPFYWSTLEPEQGKPRFTKDSPKIYRRPVPDLCLEYCEEKGIMPKAHCLNYASFTPDWAKGDVAKEKACLDKRFRELAQRYSSRIRDWEVTNETFWGYHKPNLSNFYDADDFVQWSFATAEKYFNANRLIINEAHCRIWDNEHFFANRSPYFMQIERAMRNGARIDSIGMQFHMFYKAEDELAQTPQFYSPTRLYDVMDTYAKLGTNIQITELTIPAYAYTQEDEELQAEIIRNLYSIWFSHPAMEAIIYWNLVDGFAHGAKQGDMKAGENYFHGGLIRYDFTPKPAYTMIQNLFQKEWRTNLNLKTDTDQLKFKGFYGDYDLTIDIQGRQLKKSITLGKDITNIFTVKC